MHKMKRIFFLFFIFIFIFLVGTLAFSNLVSAGCSLGVNPLHVNANVQPGGTVVVKWNFYNLYGDRTTHVSVSKTGGPNWKISYEPELHEEQYEVSGVVESIEENLAVEKRDIVPEKGSEEGWVYLKHPNEKGYILAKELKIYIEVPETTELWKNYKFIFKANGNCFSEPGTVPVSGGAQLEVKITPTTSYYEKPYGEKETIVKSLGRKIVGLISEPSQMNPVTMIISGMTLILFIIFIILLIIARGKKKKRKK